LAVSLMALVVCMLSSFLTHFNVFMWYKGYYSPRLWTDYKRSVNIMWKMFCCISLIINGPNRKSGASVQGRWGQTIKRVGDDKIIYSGDDSCVLLQSGWHACIDLMSAKRKFDPKARRLLPKKTAIIDFYYKSKNWKWG
jgi:hypothetical protein